jgi:hypothetical protein
MKDRSNSYTEPLCDIRYAGHAIGVRVEADRFLSITPFGPTLHTTRWDIGDRATINEFARVCQGELDQLAAAAKSFGELCNRLYAHRQVAGEFDALNESWWT